MPDESGRLTVGSLFAGIGGFDLGFERAGMRTLWFCEQDPFCAAVLDKHWPGTPCWTDVRALRRSVVPQVDVLCGGFPCQDISWAGPGDGIGGSRSGLWTEYARLIGEIRPRYVVVENVAALLARGMGVVLGDLAALGYDAEWDCIPASAVGAPHQRDRIWIVGYPNDERCAELRHIEFRQVSGEGGWWKSEPNVGRVAHGVPRRVDRLIALGNSLVPQIAEWLGRGIVSDYKATASARSDPAQTIKHD